MGKFIDLTGQRFGRLTVVKRVANTKQNTAQWLCLCDCGSKSIVPSSSLVRGLTKSCGCLKKETNRQKFEQMKQRQKEFAQKRIRPLYTIWRQMKYRCQNPGAQNYHNYGGRGIYVCDEWNHNYFSFQAWAIESGYSSGLSIDRIDNDGPYSPENCRWATPKIQSNNQRRTIHLTYNGQTKPLGVWATELGISRHTLSFRHKQGWPDERILTEPIQKRKK